MTTDSDFSLVMGHGSLNNTPKLPESTELTSFKGLAFDVGFTSSPKSNPTIDAGGRFPNGLAANEKVTASVEILTGDDEVDALDASEFFGHGFNAIPTERFAAMRDKDEMLAQEAISSCA